MADKRYSVYYLLDPVSNQVRYVGYSCRPSARFRYHLRDVRKSHKVNWMTKLRSEGFAPIFAIKCVVQTHEEACRVEIALIAHLRSQGAPLTNETAGGDGTIGLSVEARSKQRVATQSAWKDPQVKAARSLAISSAKRGVPQSETHRAALTIARNSEEVRAKHRKPHSEEWKNNIRAGWAKRNALGIPRTTAKPWTAERRAKVDATWAAKRTSAAA